jgi:hypothetical protein
VHLDVGFFNLFFTSYLWDWDFIGRGTDDETTGFPTFRSSLGFPRFLARNLHKDELPLGY